MDNLFLDKYKPTKIEEFVGNKQSVTKLNTFFKSLVNNEKCPYACAIVGPHGVGKTLLVKLLLDKYNLQSYSLIDDGISQKNDLTINHFFGNRPIPECYKRVNDNFPAKFVARVDGITGLIPESANNKTKILSTIKVGLLSDEDLEENSSITDRETIKKSFCNATAKSPVIFTCTNLYPWTAYKTMCSKKNVGIIIYLNSPDISEVLPFAQKIIKIEKCLIDDAALRMMIEMFKGDIRKLVINLDFYARNSISKNNTQYLTKRCFENAEIGGNMLHSMKLIGRLFCEKPTIAEKYDKYKDMLELIHLVRLNYTKSQMYLTKKQCIINKLADASELISDSVLLEYSHADAAFILGTIGVGLTLPGRIVEPVFSDKTPVSQNKFTDYKNYRVVF
jgi:GTPase SAR1 family protein